jgi:hypothetical protein
MGNSGWICSEKVSTKTDFLKIGSWCLVGCTPSLHDCCMLYRGLVGSVLEECSVCYSGNARTHMLRLESIKDER